MKYILALATLAASALALAPSLVAADTIPEGVAAHFFSTQSTSRPDRYSKRRRLTHASPPPDSSLVFAPEGSYSGASLVAALAGDGSSSDITALYSAGTGSAGQIAYGDWCVSARGVVPGSASQTLFVEACSDDPAQLRSSGLRPQGSSGCASQRASAPKPFCSLLQIQI